MKNLFAKFPRMAVRIPEDDKIIEEHVRILGSDNDDDDMPPPRPLKKGLIVYLIDTSGSMRGQKIDSANNAMRKSIEAIRSVSEGKADVHVSVLSFNDDCTLVTGDKPVSVKDYEYVDLTAGGLTCLSKAYDLLDDGVLNKEKLLTGGSANWFAPVVIVISDGVPTDEYLQEEKKYRWESSLEKLNGNAYFKQAKKIAIAIDCTDDNRQVLTAFTGSSESVLETSNMEEFGRLLEFVSMLSVPNHGFEAV